jgi:glutamate-1-semialdehyde aminotransferase
MKKETFDNQIKPINLEKSYQMLNEAMQLTPGGMPGIRKPALLVYGEYPIFFEKGTDGMHVVDVDGNDYIDYQVGWGPIILGYVEEEINSAVINRINKGFCFSGVQPEMNKLEEKLKEVIPCCEKSFLAKTGSDALTIALRIARAYTSKNKVISWGYHGWHDWCSYESFIGKDIPKEVADLTIVVPWDDLDKMEQVLSNDKDIAAIITTPIFHELSMPLKGSVKYLRGLRKLADKYNVVLVFDEIRTGFRMAMGGAQEYYNVIPDLGCFGKAMGNGYSISAVCGKKDIMDMLIDNVDISSTFFFNSLEFVATLKTIEIVGRDNVIDNIRDKGLYLKNGCDKITSKYTNVKAYYATDSDLSIFPFILFKEQEKLKEKRDYFFTYLIRKGIYLHPSHHGYISFRHTKKDLDYTLEVIDEALNFLNKQYL